MTDVDVEISNNLFHDNELTSTTPVSIEDPPTLGWVYNNVWSRNVHGYALISPAPELLFENNIIHDSTGGGIDVRWAGDDVAYNNSYGNSDYDWQTSTGSSPPGTNISVDPRFVDAANADFSLTTGFSPCIDAGNPLIGYNDADGSRNDLGAFGGPGGPW